VLPTQALRTVFQLTINSSRRSCRYRTLRVPFAPLGTVTAYAPDGHRGWSQGDADNSPHIGRRRGSQTVQTRPGQARLGAISGGATPDNRAASGCPARHLQPGRRLAGSGAAIAARAAPATATEAARGLSRQGGHRISRSVHVASPGGTSRESCFTFTPEPVAPVNHPATTRDPRRSRSIGG